MPRTHSVTVYKFSELSEVAQEKAIETCRDINTDYEWWDTTYNDIAEIAEILGIDLKQKPVKLMNGSTRYDPEIWFSGFYSQGNGSSFVGSYSYAKSSKKKIRDYAPQDTDLQSIADRLFQTQKTAFYSLTASIETACRDTCIRISVDREDGHELTEAQEEEIKEAIEDFNHWIYSQLRKEYEYLISNEVVKETIEANEYEFTENGSIFHVF